MISGSVLDMFVSSRTYPLNLTVLTKVSNTTVLADVDIQSSSVSSGLIRVVERRSH